jgi:hypothetical protein
MPPPDGGADSGGGRMRSFSQDGVFHIADLPDPHQPPPLHRPYRAAQVRVDRWTLLIERVRFSAWIVAAASAGALGAMLAMARF